MTIDRSGTVTAQSPWHPERWPGWLPYVVGLILMAVPAIANLGQQTWSTEAGTHGPIVLTTGLWLLHYNGLRLKDAGTSASDWRITALLLGLSLVLYTFGRAFDFISLEVAGLYGAFISLLYRLFGWPVLRQQAFPLVYLAFVIPPPGWVMARITAPLQTFISWSAEHIMGLFGYPVARQGVMLTVERYQLLVEDACAGLNSLTGLIAVSLLYIFLMHRASLRYSLMLVLVIIPVAILVNLLRVLTLIFITYHFGDAAAQGFMHATTGLVLFALAVLMIFGIDRLLIRFSGRRAPR